MEKYERYRNERGSNVQRLTTLKWRTLGLILLFSMMVSVIFCQFIELRAIRETVETKKEQKLDLNKERNDLINYLITQTKTGKIIWVNNGLYSYNNYNYDSCRSWPAIEKDGRGISFISVNNPARFYDYKLFIEFENSSEIVILNADYFTLRKLYKVAEQSSKTYERKIEEGARRDNEKKELQIIRSIKNEK